MKIIFIFYLMLIHVFVGVLIIKTDIISRIQVKLGYEVIEDELTPHYRTMLAFHKRVEENIPEDYVLFIGDSITQGLAVSAVYPQSVNFGIGQDTTFGVLSRLPHYSYISKSKLIVITIGVNDLRRRENSRIVDNFKNIIELIPEEIPVLFNAILPINENASNRPGDNARIGEINAMLKEICLSNPRLFFVDTPKPLLDSKGNLSGSYHIGDGVHLNGLGNDIWIIKLKAEVKNAIEQYERAMTHGK